jgi:hypothetical protein
MSSQVGFAWSSQMQGLASRQFASATSSPPARPSRRAQPTAAIGLIQERALRERNMLGEQLQAALNSRVIIEQAKGMLAEYLTVTVDDAFELLRNYARSHNRKLSEIASDAVDRQLPAAALTDNLASNPSVRFSPSGQGDGLCNHYSGAARFCKSSASASRPAADPAYRPTHLLTVFDSLAKNGLDDGGRRRC